MRRIDHGVVLSLLLLLLLLVVFSVERTSAATTSTSFGARSQQANPYEVLGVPKGADQGMIRRRYRKLCLKYHPDKNVGGSEAERKRCEEAFKKVQGANDLIGDEESRRHYDTMASSPFHQYRNGAAAASGAGGYGGYGSAPPRTGTGPSAHDFFRSFYNEGSPYRRNTRRAFYFNGVDISNLFPGVGRAGPSFGSPAAAAYNPDDEQKSVFVERVTIPLEELYTGVDRKILELSDTMIQRYRSAFRGGLAKQLALQSLVSSIALLLRTSVPVSALVFCLTFHLGLPHPTRLHYQAQIGRGWKSGTKVTFKSPEPGLDVVFVIEEGTHERFVRSGDDLCTTVKIGEKQARRGCRIHIEPLGSSELPIVMELRPREIVDDGTVKRIAGKGWPRRKKGGRGDLLVEVRIVSDSKTGCGKDDAASAASAGRKKLGRRKKRRKSKIWHFLEREIFN